MLVVLAGCGETARPNIIPGDAGEVGVIADDRATTDAPEDTGAPVDMTVPPGDAGDATLNPPPDGMTSVPDGTVMLPDGMMMLPDGMVMPPPDTGVRPDVMDAGPQCPTGLLLCGTCVNPMFDNTHCGGCNQPCAAGSMCLMGACRSMPEAGMLDMGLPPDTGPICPTGQMFCGTACLDIRSNNAHCGGCNRTCLGGAVCMAGVCQVPFDAGPPDMGVMDTGPMCAAGQTLCGTMCLNLASDDFNCGACNNRCPTGQRCMASRCTPTSSGCTGGTTDCSGYCANTTNDPFHCGACNNRCPTGQVCAGSRCTAMSDGGPPDTGSVTCPAGTTNCGGYCANTSNDPFHCGACNNRCPTGQVCANSRCGSGNMDGGGMVQDTGVTCTGGTTNCGGYCANTQTDPFHCGMCNNQCPAGQTCAGARCSGTGSCTGGTTNCGGYCANTSNDPFHCGGCNQRCPTGQVCAGGRCGSGNVDGGTMQLDTGVVNCPTGTTNCNGYCANTSNDPFHCGRCNNACATGALCTGGVCGSGACTGGTTNCGGYCANTSNDPFHCGGCNQRCPTGMMCVNSRCGTGNVDGGMMQLDTGVVNCTGGTVNCSGYCANTSNDPFNCGACNVRCASGQTCSSGRCTGTGTCPTGTTNCGGGYCANTSNDPMHCGGCGMACPTGQFCVNSRCSVTAPDGGSMMGDTGNVMCPTGRTNCSGYCADTTNDPSHCGRCGNACPSGQMCVASRCGGSGCMTGETDCGGFCADLLTNPGNCGGCNMACATGQVCSGGRCMTAGACGAAGQACCSSGTPCTGTLICVSGQCMMMPTNCGRVGQACCAPPIGCEPPATCTGGVCR